jgi:hypothetical protein
MTYFTDKKGNEAFHNVREKYFTSEDGTEEEWNDFIGAIANFARQLTDEKLDALRMTYAQGGETPYLAKQECLGMSKGQLVEALLYDTFCQETL